MGSPEQVIHEIVIGIVLIVIAWFMEPLRKKLEETHPKWVKWIPPFWGFARNLAILCIIYYGVVGHSVFYDAPVSVTSKNVEDQIKTWLIHSGYLCDGSTEGTYYAFHLDCGAKAGRVIGIGRPKQRDDLILITIYTQPTQDRNSHLENLPKEQLVQLVQDLSILALNFGAEAPPQDSENDLRKGSWLIQRSIHIDGEMRPEVLDSMRRLQLAVAASEQTIDRRLNIATGMKLP